LWLAGFGHGGSQCNGGARKLARGSNGCEVSGAGEPSQGTVGGARMCVPSRWQGEKIGSLEPWLNPGGDDAVGNPGQVSGLEPEYADVCAGNVRGESNT
jgi:hypothetical protein